MPRLRYVLGLLFLSLPASLLGCDAIAEVVGVDEFDVSLGSNAQVPILPSSAGTVGTEARIDDRIPDVFDVSDISIPEDAVTFDAATPGAGRSGSSRCEVELYIMVDEIPALQSTIVVDDEASPAVRSVTSRFAQAYTRSDICSEFGGDCPVVSGSRTPEQIRDRVNAAVDRRAFDLDIVAVNDGPCAGLLTIDRIHFELDF
ncbi:MAG: hypothetical protein R3181_12465 [Rubricoccaceae bacterium]|nr:hypothetical protein [Rubricoccaceae bacterium]